jgi:hypothetical protein
MPLPLRYYTPSRGGAVQLDFRAAELEGDAGVSGRSTERRAQLAAMLAAAEAGRDSRARTERGPIGLALADENRRRRFLSRASLARPTRRYRGRGLDPSRARRSTPATSAAAPEPGAGDRRFARRVSTRTPSSASLGRRRRCATVARHPIAVPSGFKQSERRAQFSRLTPFGLTKPPEQHARQNARHKKLVWLGCQAPIRRRSSRPG